MKSYYTWYAHRHFQSQGMDLILVSESNGRRSIGQPIDIVLKEEESVNTASYSEPTLKLIDGAAQSLLQALWDAGLRPNNGEGTSAHVDALKHNIYFAEEMAKKLIAVNSVAPGDDTFNELRKTIIKSDEHVAALVSQLRMMGVAPVQVGL